MCVFYMIKQKIYIRKNIHINISYLIHNELLQTLIKLWSNRNYGHSLVGMET